jgi:hypothetical protein
MSFSCGYVLYSRDEGIADLHKLHGKTSYTPRGNTSTEVHVFTHHVVKRSTRELVHIRKREVTMSYPELTVEDARRYITEARRTSTARTFIVTMLPETASWLLRETNTDNVRQQNPRTVTSYTQQRMDLLWVDVVADIAIGTDGILDNGQHVLEFISHGLPTVVRFTVGMPLGAENVFDTQRNRTFRQVMVHQGVSEDATQALRQWVPLKNGLRSSAVPPIEPGRIQAVWGENPWFAANIDEALAAGERLHGITRTSKPIAAAMYLWIKKNSPTELENPGLVGEFFDGMCGIGTTGEFDPRYFAMRSLQSSPVLRLANGRRPGGAGSDHREKIVLAKTWNHWASDVEARAYCAFDNPRKPETVVFSDGTDLPRGMKIPELV